MVSDLPDGPHDEPATCAVHGDYMCRVNVLFGRKLKMGCAACNKIANDAREEEERARKLERERYEMSVKLGSALIPRRFQGKSFDSYIAETPEQRNALAKCVEYAESFDRHFDAGRCMLLLGKPGTGKTHLGIAIANHIMTNTREQPFIER